MKIHLYLSLNPEALVASHLPPEEFGAYLAVGTQKYSRGQAMFFEVDPAGVGAFAPFQNVEARCVPHLDGSPRRSTYLAIYRVLEHVPIAALGQLHLATHDGRVLSLGAAPIPQTVDRCFHLYQEFCPVTPARRQLAGSGGILRAPHRSGPAGHRAEDRLRRAVPRHSWPTTSIRRTSATCPTPASSTCANACAS